MINLLNPNKRETQNEKIKINKNNRCSGTSETITKELAFLPLESLKKTKKMGWG